MDISSLLGTFMSNDSVSSLSQAANVSDESTRSVLSAALPLLLNGAMDQSSNSETAEGFAGALSQHAADDTSNIGSFLSGVDLSDGSKIVSHLLGSNAGSTVSQVSEKAGVSQEQAGTILSAVAPLLMSLLGKETNSQQSANGGLDVTSILGSLLGKVDIGSMLSGFLGGGAASGSSKDDKEGGGILGSLLGLLK